MARRRRNHSAHGSESDGSYKPEVLRALIKDPESIPGMLRRASATYFGKDIAELDDDDLVDTVGEFAGHADKMPLKNLTKGIVGAYLGYLKKKYGLIRHVREHPDAG